MSERPANPVTWTFITTYLGVLRQPLGWKLFVVSYFES